MDLIAPPLAALLWLPCAVVIFLLPGYALARRLGAPAPWPTAFLGSSAILFNLALALNALGLPLHAGTVGLGLAALAGLFWKLPSHPRIEPATAWPHGWQWALLTGPALALLSIAVRAAIDPLSGYDNGFRWDYLARLIWAHRSLGGYPPISSADFEFYAWCDGIPPLASLLNFWIYAVAGSIAPSLTIVRILGETVLLGALVVRYARLLWGEHGGIGALAAFAASALVLWSLAMGQETGLTALSLVGMLYFLELNARQPELRTVFWAGVAGGVGALARDYTSIFPVLGLLVLLLRRAGWRPLLVFAATAAAIGAPWYVRNFLITGNPLYPQTLGGLFPGNAVHDEIMRYIADEWSPGSSEFSAIVIPFFLAALTGFLALVGGVGLVRAGRRSWPAAAGIALVAALWWIALPQTGGGWVYASRVLLPALALLAVAAGWIGTVQHRIKIVLFAILALVTVDAARRSWLQPAFPRASPWTISFADWRVAKTALTAFSHNRVWTVLTQEAHGAGIVIDHPSYHALITMQGGTAVPLFSPVLRPAFDDRLSFPAALAELQHSQIRFIVLTPESLTTAKLIRAHPFLTTLQQRYAPNSTIGFLMVFDLQQLIPAAPPHQGS